MVTFQLYVSFPREWDAVRARVLQCFLLFFAFFRFKYYLLLNSHIFRDTKFWLSHGLIHLFLVISPLTIFIDVSSFYFSFQPTFLIWSKGQLILHVLPMIFAWTYHLLCLNNPSLSLSSKSSLPWYFCLNYGCLLKMYSR